MAPGTHSVPKKFSVKSKWLFPVKNFQKEYISHIFQINQCQY